MAGWLPIVGRLVRYRSDWLRPDVVAGATVLVLLVPQAMAYASLAGMPPATGLYAALAGLLVYALLGTSSHLSFGPVALISLLTASALEPFVTAGGDYLSIAGSLAILVGLWLLALAVVHAGAIVNLLSHPVISGYISAAALIIGVSQVPTLLGLEGVDGGAVFGEVLAIVRALPEADPAMALIGVGSLGIMLLGKKLPAKVPVPLLVIVGVTVLSALVDLESRGVPVVGGIPSGLPLPRWPFTGSDGLRQLTMAALPIALIAYAEGISVAKALALRSREVLRSDRELVASGAANLASGVLGGFPVAGSFTRSAVNVDAGARTQVSGLIAAVGVGLVLLVLTPLFFHLPRSVLAAIVILAVIGLIDVGTARRIWRLSRREGAALLFTSVATLVFGVEFGLLLGVGANLAIYLAQQARPRLIELGRVVGTTAYRDADRYPVVVDDRVAILRLGGPLDYLNAGAVFEQVIDLAAQRPDLVAILVDGSSLTALDATGLHTLESLVDELDAAGTDLRISTIRRPVHEMLARSGRWPVLRDRCHASLEDALDAVGIAPSDTIRSPQLTERAPTNFV